MTAIPQATKTKKVASARPQLTEDDYQEIGELNVAQEYQVGDEGKKINMKGIVVFY